jgi:hypothetical protein
MGSDTTAIIIAYRKGLDIKKYLQSLEQPKNLPDFFFNFINFKSNLSQFHEWAFNYNLWHMYTVEEKIEALDNVKKVFSFEEKYEILINYFEDDKFCREEDEWSEEVMYINLDKLLDVEELINLGDEGVAVLAIADPMDDDISSLIFKGIDFLINKNSLINYHMEEIDAKIYNYLEENTDKDNSLSDIYINVFVAAGYWRDRLLKDKDQDKHLYIDHPLYRIAVRRLERMVKEKMITRRSHERMFYYKINI